MRPFRGVRRQASSYLTRPCPSLPSFEPPANAEVSDPLEQARLRHPRFSSCSSSPGAARPGWSPCCSPRTASRSAFTPCSACSEAIARERHVAHAGRCRRRPGVQRRVAPRCDERRDRERLLRRPPAAIDRLEHRARSRARRSGVRPIGREAPGRGVLHQSEGAPSGATRVSVAFEFRLRDGHVELGQRRSGVDEVGIVEPLGEALVDTPQLLDRARLPEADE